MAGWILLQEENDFGGTLHSPPVTPHASAVESPQPAEIGVLDRTAIEETFTPDLSMGRVQVRGAGGEPLSSSKYYLLTPFLGGVVSPSYAQLTANEEVGNAQGFIEVELKNLQAQTLVVWATGYVPQRVQIRPGGDQSIQLAPACLCRVEVSKEDGTAIPRFQFRWTDPNQRLDGFPLTGFSSKSKPAVITVPCDKPLQLEVSVPGMGYQKKLLTLHELKETVTISLPIRSGFDVHVVNGYGDPVPDVQARFSRAPASSSWQVHGNQQGFLSLAGIPSGDWQISLSAKGHISREFARSFSEVGFSEQTWLLPRAGTLQVNLVNRQDENLPGVTLRMRGPGEGEPVRATTDEQGTARFSGLGPSAWILQANGPNGGGVSPPISIDLEEGAEETVRMQLENWQNLNVRIFHQGNPAPGVTGLLFLPSPWRSQLPGLDRSDAEGRLAFPAIPDVSVDAEFRLNAWALPATERWEKIQGEKLRVTLPAGTAQGSWVAGGIGIAGVTVEVDRGRGLPVAVGQSGANGEFLVHCVGPGRYRFRPQHPQWVSAQEPPWYNHNGGELILEPQELTRAGIIGGLVDSPLLKQPFFAIQVRLIGPEGREWGGMWVSEEGAFSFPRVPWGDYQLVFQQGNQVLAERRVELFGVRAFSRIQFPD